MAIKRFGTGDAVNEGTDAEYACKFYDAGLGTPIVPGASILTIVLTLTDVESGNVINTREGQTVWNANGGTLVGDQFTMRFTGLDDMVIVNQLDPQGRAIKVGAMEKHRIQLYVTYDRGGVLPTGYLRHEVLFDVINLTAND